MCSKCNEHHDEDCCCCEEEKELVRDRRELTDEEIESIIVEKYNTKDEKTKVFIRKALKKQGDWYDYSKAEYKKAKTKVTIVCPIHKNFEQTPNNHLYNSDGCPDCAGNRKYTKDTFIEAARKVHKDKYNYDNINYINANKKITIHCNTCNNDFNQLPSAHLFGAGCPYCYHKIIGDKFRKSTEQFIKEAKLVHGDNKYDYSKVNYINNREKVIIHCNTHNIDFLQSPGKHLAGQGCPLCKPKSRGEILTSEYLGSVQIQYNSNAFISFAGRNMFPDFVLIDKNIWLEYNGIQHYSKSECFHSDMEEFIDQLERDLNKRNYCRNNEIKLIEIPYTLNTYEKISDFLDKVLLQNIDPNTLVDYSKLYKLDNTGLNLEDLFPS